MKQFYVAELGMLTISIDRVDADGKPVMRYNRNSRQDEQLHDIIQFTTEQSKPSLGTLCKFLVTDETPKHIVEALEELADDPSSSVLREKDYIKKTNPTRAAAEMRAEELDAKLAEADRKLKELDGEVERKSKALQEMEEELEQLTSPKKKKDN